MKSTADREGKPKRKEQPEEGDKTKVTRHDMKIRHRDRRQDRHEKRQT